MIDATAMLSALCGAALASIAALILWRRRSADLEAAHRASLQALQTQHEQQRTHAHDSYVNDKAAALLDADRRHELNLMGERERLGEQLQASLQDAEKRHEEQVKKIQSPLTVLVHPFVNTSVEKGLIRNSSVVEVGYKYQLMVQGIPCFPPHDVVVERQSKVEIDEKAIAAFSAKALELAEGVTRVGGGGAASALISVAKTVVRSRL